MQVILSSVKSFVASDVYTNEVVKTKQSVMFSTQIMTVPVALKENKMFTNDHSRFVTPSVVLFIFLCNTQPVTALIRYTLNTKMTQFKHRWEEGEKKERLL
ncbi:hypothetical protein TNCV_4656031 [Trichonephila clavipes]|nr:hypothetical protein TNCV_4656031 [Trichonephila clavipes]